MILNQDTTRKIRSIGIMLEDGKIEREGYLNLLTKAKNKDFEVHLIMVRSYAKAVSKYEDYKGEVALSNGKKGGLYLHEKDSWIVEDFLEQKKEELHNEKQFMRSVVPQELRSTLIQREKELKGFHKSRIKKERAEALGLKYNGLKKAIGLSR